MLQSVLAFARANPAIDVYVLASLLSVLYALLGKSKNARVHAVFSVLQSVGFDPQGLASSLVQLVSGKSAAPAAPSSMGPAAKVVQDATAAADQALNTPVK